MHAALQRRQASTRTGKVSDATILCRCTICESQGYVIVDPEACRVTNAHWAVLFSFIFLLDEAAGDKILYREVTGRRTHLLGNACGSTRAETARWEESTAKYFDIHFHDLSLLRARLCTLYLLDLVRRSSLSKSRPLCP